MNGVAITRRKKDIPVLKIPSKEEIDAHKEQLKKEKLWGEIYDFVVAPNENMDEPYNIPLCPDYITSVDLDVVLKILHGNYKETDY